jgi:hypothetical protein
VSFICACFCTRSRLNFFFTFCSSFNRVRFSETFLSAIVSVANVFGVFRRFFSSVSVAIVFGVFRRFFSVFQSLLFSVFFGIFSVFQSQMFSVFFGDFSVFQSLLFGQDGSFISVAKPARNRVTRLVEFSPIGRLIISGSSYKKIQKYEDHILVLFYSAVFILRRNGLG